MSNRSSNTAHTDLIPSVWLPMDCRSRAVSACILVPAVMWCSHPKSPNVFFYHTCQTVDVFAVAPPVPCRRFSSQVVLRLVPVSHITNQSALLAGCWALAANRLFQPGRTSQPKAFFFQAAVSARQCFDPSTWRVFSASAILLSCWYISSQSSQNFSMSETE